MIYNGKPAKLTFRVSKITQYYLARLTNEYSTIGTGCGISKQQALDDLVYYMTSSDTITFDDGADEYTTLYPYDISYHGDKLKINRKKSWMQEVDEMSYAIEGEL